MKIKKNLIGLCLVGVTLISNVSVYAAIGDTVKSGRVPAKPAYFGVDSIYSQSCIDAGFACHDFDCPSTLVEANDYAVFKDGKVIGDVPSYNKNKEQFNLKYLLQNEMPFTLPVGKISINSIFSTDKFPNVEIEIKKGLNSYNVTVDGEVIKTAPIVGVSLNRELVKYKDLNSKHWAYDNVTKALKNGWIDADSNDKVGMEQYKDVFNHVTGKKNKVRVDGMSPQEVFRGINRVLMSNGIYAGKDSSRTDIHELFRRGAFDTESNIQKLIMLDGNYNKYADWLNLCLNTTTVSTEQYTPIEVYSSISDINLLETSSYDRYELSMLLHSVVYDLDLPIVNNMSGNEYSYYDATSIRNNYVVGSGYRTGSTQYCISRGLISAGKINGKYSGFSDGIVGKPEFATILCNLDRAIKASKSK